MRINVSHKRRHFLIERPLCGCRLTRDPLNSKAQRIEPLACHWATTVKIELEYDGGGITHALEKDTALRQTGCERVFTTQRVAQMIDKFVESSDRVGDFVFGIAWRCDRLCHHSPWSFYKRQCWTYNKDVYCRASPLCQ